MFIPFTCAVCRHTLRGRDCYRGQSMRCPHCGTVVSVPATLPATPIDPVPPASPKHAGPAVVGRLPRRALLAVALLPLGLPLLQLGDVVEAALGCGLTLVCWGLVRRERWTPTLRVAAALCVAGVGYGLLGAAWLLGRATEPEATPAATRPAAARPAYAVAPAAHPMNGPFPPPGADPFEWQTAVEDRGRAAPIQADMCFVAPLGPLLTVAVDPASAAALVTTREGLLALYSYPDLHLRATYRLPQPAYRSALDGRRGLLYTAVSDPGALTASPFANRERGRGDIHVYDVRALLAGRHQAAGPLEPVRTLPLGANVAGLQLSPDRAWLYYLAESPRGTCLGRLPTATAAPPRELPLPGRAEALCLPPDGRRVYVALTDAVLAIDPLGLRIETTMPMKVPPSDLAASDAGIVFVGCRGQWTRVHVLDMRRGWHLADWSADIPGRVYLRLAGGGRRLYLGSAAATANTLRATALTRDVSRPPLTIAEGLSTRNGLARGEFFLTPDSRFLINRWGKVYRLAPFP